MLLSNWRVFLTALFTGFGLGGTVVYVAYGLVPAAFVGSAVAITSSATLKAARLESKVDLDRPLLFVGMFCFAASMVSSVVDVWPRNMIWTPLNLAASWLIFMDYSFWRSLRKDGYAQH